MTVGFLNSKSGSCGAERWTVPWYTPTAELNRLHETPDSLDLTVPDSTRCFPVFPRLSFGETQTRSGS